MVFQKHHFVIAQNALLSAVFIAAVLSALLSVLIQGPDHHTAQAFLQKARQSENLVQNERLVNMALALDPYNKDVLSDFSRIQKDPAAMKAFRRLEERFRIGTGVQ